MKYVGKLSLRSYRLFTSAQAKLFSLLVAGGFAQYGKRTVIAPPLRIWGEARIALGSNVHVGSGSWLQALADGDNRAVAIFVGSGTSIAGNCVISAMRSVVIEAHVLLARNVYISDHMHRYDLLGVPILSQGIHGIRPVVIKEGAWLGQNVVVCPGVTIGRGAVIGANSLVNADVPDFCVAAGTPARIVKQIGMAAI
jgi:acetyltransferase-like isoleucine patch superfamily enzyme